MDKFNQLMIANDGNITEKQKDFVNTHKAIIYSGTMITDFAINLAENLKKMKDEKLYKEAGFEAFADYTEQACGIKERQAYNYIRVLEQFDKQYLQSNAKYGVTKLGLLASLAPEEREVIEAEVKVEEISTKELKEEIEKVKQERDIKFHQYEMNLSELNQSLENKTSEHNKSLAQIEKLKKEVKDLKNQPKEKEYIQDPEQQAKIESLERLNNVHQKTIKIQAKQLEEQANQQAIASSVELTEFKFLFDEVQMIISKLKRLANLVPEDKREGCKLALKKVGEMLC